MEKKLVLKNKLKDIRKDKKISQQELADMVGVSRNTIISNFANSQEFANIMARYGIK